MALLVDTSHPMIRPEVEAGLEEARRVLQDGGKFCLQVTLIYSKILTL
jgi:ubiquinone/menaquinone biosynthesis C-methylase UbiE